MNNEQILFSENHLFEVSNVLNAHYHSLEQLEEFKELEDEMLRITDILFEKLSQEDQETFRKLSLIQGELESYTNALLYSLGIKYGIELKKL